MSCGEQTRAFDTSPDKKFVQMLGRDGFCAGSWPTQALLWLECGWVRQAADADAQAGADDSAGPLTDLMNSQHVQVELSMAVLHNGQRRGECVRLAV
jgi:hypothetical protein